MCKYLYLGNNTREYISLCCYIYYSCSHNWQSMSWKYYNDIIFFIYVVWLFSAKVSIRNPSGVKFPSKYQLCSVSAGLFNALLGYSRIIWKIPQKYRLNFVSKTFRIVFFDWNSIKIPLKFHQNTTQILTNITKISSKYKKNTTRIPVLSSKNWMVFHWNNPGKHAVIFDKIGNSIPLVF